MSPAHLRMLRCIDYADEALGWAPGPVRQRYLRSSARRLREAVASAPAGLDTTTLAVASRKLLELEASCV